MSQLVFRGNSYEKMEGSRVECLTPLELVYRRRVSINSRNNIIRSKKTALLLQLDNSTNTNCRLVYRGCLVSPYSSCNRSKRTIQPGGFIRSRMTAELIGVDPSPVSRATVRPGGFLRSRRLAALLEIESTLTSCLKKVYRGVEYSA